MKLFVALTAALFLGITSTVYAQDPDPEDFTPEGYTFCGWKDFTTGQWQTEWDESLAGAFLRAFADGMTCRDARRATTRTLTRQLPPYAPYRPGYRCKRLVNDHEYSDVRCVKIGGSRKYRFQTGA